MCKVVLLFFAILFLGLALILASAGHMLDIQILDRYMVLRTWHLAFVGGLFLLLALLAWKVRAYS